MICEERFQRGPNKGRVKTGTKAGYNAHRAIGEAACQACLIGNRQASLDWQRENPTRHKEHERDRCARDREKRAIMKRKRAAAVKALPGFATEEERASSLAYHGGLCWYCLQEPATLFDHLVNYDKPGSTNNIYNLIPCCKPCNSSKGNKDLEEWRPDIVERIELDRTLA